MFCRAFSLVGDVLVCRYPAASRRAIFGSAYRGATMQPHTYTAL